MGWGKFEIPLSLSGSLVTFCPHRKSLARRRNIPKAPPKRSAVDLPLVGPAHQVVQADVEVVGQKHQTKGGRVALSILIILIGSVFDPSNISKLVLSQMLLVP